MNSLYQLSRPWAYWFIKGPGKSVFDWWLPLIFALIVAVTVDASKHQINFFGVGGVVSMLTGFIQNLPGFFIAALAAVATFDRDELDKVMPEPTPSICVYIKGQWARISLTRRRFLSAMFAFLTVQSIFITLVGIGVVSCAGWLNSFDGIGLVRRWLSFGGATVYCIFLWQMITVTCLGLYYLGDRIHQPES